MSRSYPIWNDVEACHYSADKSYGNKNTGAVTVRVGTSRTNSEVLVEHVTTRREEGDYTIFKFGVDTGSGLKVLKTMWMHTKTRKWYKRKPAELKLAA